MIMEFMGPDLHDVCTSSGIHCSTATIISLLQEILQRVEKLHETGMVHRDIKPENICFGMENDDVDIRLLDLGMCTPFLCSETGKQLPMEYGSFVRGTVLFCSSNQHDGGSPTRKDDLEAVCYTMMKLCNGYLPWSRSNRPHMTLLEENEAVAPLKKQDPEFICCAFPQFFKKVLDHLKTLKYDDDPNYDYIRSILDEALLGLENEF